MRDKSASHAVVTAIDPKADRKAAAGVQLFRADGTGDSPVLLLVLFMGAFGALLGAMRSFVNFVGSRAFVPSWSFYYLSRPVFGAGLAIIVFFAYRIGALTGPKNASPADPFAAAFIAGVVGLFADIFLQKLKELVTQLFRPEDSRSDKLTGGPASSVPVISGSAVDQGTLTISGTNFASGATVTINGTAIPATFVDSTRLTIVLPANLAVKGTKLAVIVINPDGTKSASFSGSA